MSTLDNLRKAARRWLKALRANDPDATARLRRAYPDAPTTPGLRDVQHALARERGAENWIALKQQSESALTSLLRAAETGDASRLVEILDAHPAIINERGLLDGHAGRRTALHFGVSHEAVVRALLDRGADPNIRDEGDNAMPLHFAAENQDFPVIRMLIAHGADPIGAGDGHELDVIGWSCCWDYREPNREIVEYLLAHGARHNIFSAVAMGDVDAIRALVAASPENLARRMDSTNKRRTPLHLAAIKKQPAAIEALVALGADLETENAAGLTPLDEAATYGFTGSAQLLIDSGAQVRLPAAVALGRTDDVERLVREDPDAVRPGGRYDTLIVRASATQPKHVIETLLRLGADVNARDSQETSVDGTEGYTPLHAAAFHGNDAAARVLLRHGADVNARDGKYDGTPAGWADYAGHYHLRDVILRGPIDIFQAIDFDLTERIPQLLKTDPGALTRPRGGHTPLQWAVLKKNVEAAKFLTAEASGGAKIEPPEAAPADPVATFLAFACWGNDVHGKADHRMCDHAAQRLLKQHPDLARHSLYTAIVCGDIEHVERVLRETPDAARRRGGSRGWSPILYLCYTRFTHQPAIDNAVAILRLLLDHGANPNDYYMAGHSRYSTLVGIAREGEQDAPPHPIREPLYALLLERGAYPFDIQVLYNTHFHGSILWWLELTYAATIDTPRKREWEDADWPMFDMGAYGSGARFMLDTAIKKKDVALAEWLLAHGANPNAGPARETRFPHGTLYEAALRHGCSEIAELLVRHGATPSVLTLSGEDAYVDAALRLDREAVRRHLQDHPEWRQSPTALFEAARRNRADVVRLLLDEGTPVDVSNRQNTRALHEAAAHNAIDVAKLLIERGAEIDPRERQFDSTPIGWAAYADQQEMVEFLSRYSRNVWTLCFRGYVDRLRDLLHDDPSLAKITNAAGVTPLWWLPDDEAKALDIIDVFLSYGADPAARSKNGTTAADWARKRGMAAVAHKLETASD